jgi:hypothetical protein
MHPELLLLVQLEHREWQRRFDQRAARGEFVSRELPQTAKQPSLAERLRELAVDLREKVVRYWVSGQLGDAR